MGLVIGILLAYVVLSAPLGLGLGYLLRKSREATDGNA